MHLAAVHRVPRCATRLYPAPIVLMHFLPPVGLNEVVAFEDTLDGEVVFLVALVEERFLDDGELRLKDTQQAGVTGGHTDLRADLQVLVEKHFLAHGPAYINSAEGDLVVLGLCRNFLGGEDPGAGWGQEQGQLTK